MNKPEALAFTIPEWCAHKRISRGMFYILERRGEAPETIWMGRRRIIPVRADERWEEKRLASTAQAQPATVPERPKRRPNKRGPTRGPKRAR